MRPLALIRDLHRTLPGADPSRSADATDLARRGRRAVPSASTGVAARAAGPTGRVDGGRGIRDPVGTARNRQDHSRPGDRPVVGATVRGTLGRHRRSARRARGDAGGADPARSVRTVHDPLPRRDPPLHQGAAGCAPSGRRERLGRADRGDDRESLVLGDLAAALAIAPAHPAAADGRRPRDAARPRGRRPARTGRKRDGAARGARRPRPARLGRRASRADGTGGGGIPRGAGRGRRRGRRLEGSRTTPHARRTSPPTTSPAPSTARC